MSQRLYGGNIKAMIGFLRKHSFVTDKWQPESVPRGGEKGTPPQPLYQSKAIIEVEGNELGEFENREELRDAAIARYDEFVSENLVVETGIGPVRFNGTGKRKVKSFSADARKLQIIPFLPDLLKAAKNWKREDNRNPRTQLSIKAIHRAMVPAKIGGTIVEATLLVRETNLGEFHYDLWIDEHGVGNVKAPTKAEALEDVSFGTNHEGKFTGNKATDTISTKSINPYEDGVNIGLRETGHTYHQTGPSASVQFKDDRTLTKLFEGKANASSIFHEGAHDFLQELKTLVETDEATPDLIKDWEIIKNWLGIEGIDITRKQHEKFARGFERYLYEGKAPTTELEKFFARFRRWLTEVYKTVRELDVEINNNVRGVFDRMLMADQAVAVRAEELGLMVMDKKSMDTLGILPEDQTYLARLMQGAQESASRKMFAAMHKAVKSMKAQWRKEGEARALNDPMHDTVRRLQKGRGIDRKILYDIWGKEAADRIPWHTVKHGGAPP